MAEGQLSLEPRLLLSRRATCYSATVAVAVYQQIEGRSSAYPDDEKL
jgi:hypothetical protein